jgi:hypothetical protein
MDHVDGAENVDESLLHGVVRVVLERPDQVVEPLERGLDVRGQPDRPVRHGDSPLPWDHQPQPTASIGCSPWGIAATSAAVTA